MSIKCVLAYLSTQMQYSIPRQPRQEDLWDSLANQQLWAPSSVKDPVSEKKNMDGSWGKKKHPRLTSDLRGHTCMYTNIDVNTHKKANEKKTKLICKTRDLLWTSTRKNFSFHLCQHWANSLNKCPFGISLLCPDCVWPHLLPRWFCAFINNNTLRND